MAAGIATPTIDTRGFTSITFDNPLISSDAFSAAIIWFQGDPSTAPNTTVSSNTVTFLLGAVADTSVNTTGSIDFSNAASDTLGEIADLVNASTTGWRMTIVAGFRNSTVYSGGSLDVVLTALNGATYANGYATGFVWDVSKILAVRVCIGPEADASLKGGGRISAQTLRSLDYLPAEENFFKQYQPNQWQNMLGEVSGTVSNGGATATATLTAYSANQASTSTTARALPIGDNAFANATAKTLGTDSILAISSPNERLVAILTTANTPTAIAFSGVGWCNPNGNLGGASAS